MTTAPAEHHISIQFPVEKENESTPAWTDRVLSIPIREKDDDPHVVRISQKNHPEALIHHQIIAYEIYLWPHYQGEYLDRVIIGDGEESKLVVAIRGVLLEPDTEKVIVQPDHHRYWKIRFPNFDTLKQAVTAIRGGEAKSPVAMTGTLEDLAKELEHKTVSTLDEITEPVL